jgi:hypothetical protein
MSPDRSRDRWRPPDQNRGRRPAGDRTAHLENTGSNTSANGAPRLSLQARRSAELRRQRRMRMAAAAPNTRARDARRANGGFAAMYARAREEQAERWAEGSQARRRLGLDQVAFCFARRRRMYSAMTAL